MQAEVKRGTAQQRSVELEMTFPFLDVFVGGFFFCLFVLGFVGGGLVVFKKFCLLVFNPNGSRSYLPRTAVR